MNLKTLALSLSLAGSHAVADHTGLRFLELEAPHHERTIETAIWYPSDGSGNQIVFGENRVFRGVTVRDGAGIGEGRFPLVLLSHGMGGTIRSLSWLSAGLAERGAIVISVNHPNSTWGDFDLAASVQHWTRVQDLSRALDWVLNDDGLVQYLDRARIMAVGFSFGGWTALSMGGLRANHEGIVASCRRLREALELCDELLSDAVNLPAFDPAPWNANYRDDRVTHVAAIDPGLVWGLDQNDTRDLIEEVTLIGLGDGDSRLLATDFDASGLLELLSGSKVRRIRPAMHFTALPPCQPTGELILREENDDPVCTDPAGTNREAVHASILSQIASDLGL
ncbi:MAG: hypothetical protein OXI87_01355 [Albidovulum sp.]|nr:hypothetical protein [Albidovulum sp.]